MPKHDRAKQDKRDRNRAYALKYRQLVCKKCGHGSCLKGNCRNCGAPAKERKFRKKPN